MIPDEHETVTVSKRALWMLYQCAKDYEKRIPAEAHYDWAIPFIEMFDGVANEEEAR